MGEIAAKCLQEIQSFNEWFNLSLRWTNPKCFPVPFQIVLFLPLSLNLPQKVSGPRPCHCECWNTQTDLRWMSSAKTPRLTESCQKAYLYIYIKKSVYYIDPAKKFTSDTWSPPFGWDVDRGARMKPRQWGCLDGRTSTYVSSHSPIPDRRHVLKAAYSLVCNPCSSSLCGGRLSVEVRWYLHAGQGPPRGHSYGLVQAQEEGELENSLTSPSGPSPPFLSQERGWDPGGPGCRPSLLLTVKFQAVLNL